jgi:predicted aldo/keto reductase-like oxidoreductase
MAHDEMMSTDRRAFLQAGVLAAASAASLVPGVKAQEGPANANAHATAIPRRPLGKTGVEITMLDQGAVRGASHERIMRFSFASGVRVFDSAKAYGSDGDFKKWFDQEGDVRKQIFLVSKDEPRVASQIPAMVDERLAVLGTDWVDLFFIHGLGDHHSLDEAMNLVKSRELKDTVAALKKAGKIKLFGFSSHHRNRAQIIQAAAEGGIVDAIMLQYAPWLDKDAPLNKALDACWNRGVGLISMKQIAGRFFGDPPKGNILDDVVRRVPMLAEKKLTPFQGLLHAIWTDERISCCCVSMRNTDQIRENTDAARRFEPLKTTEVHELKDAVLAHGPTLCADCDGRCSVAAGTCAELGNLTRFLTYHEHLGDRAEARRQYSRLSPEARDWSGADLEAARNACPGRLDFARLLPEVDRYLA